MKLLILLLTLAHGFAQAADVSAPEALASGPSAKDKLNTYSIRTQIETCTPEDAAKCEISTFVVAKERASEALLWERRIYFQRYDVAKSIESQAVTVKSVSLVKAKILEVKNSRGDSFELAIDHGHLKKPKSPREYSK